MYLSTRLIALIGTLVASGIAYPQRSVPMNTTSGDLPLRPAGLDPKLVMERIQTAYSTNIKSTLPSKSGCTKDNITVRKEWSDLCEDEKLSYISAIQCLAKLPPKSDPTYAPGAKSRYDDFVVAHISQSVYIHVSGLLLPWHRQFVWLYEQALRNECNYTGYQPYWDWARYLDRPETANPLYDGSNTSLSGNGVYKYREPAVVPQPRGNVSLTFYPNQGGGCIDSGPFVNFSANLGPLNGPNSWLGPPNPQSDGLGYNPRCLQRDFNNTVLAGTNSYQNLTDLILNYTSMHTFHPTLETGRLPIHANGHAFIGGGEVDTFVSPVDPLFFMHHTQLDRIWAMWQALDTKGRTYAQDGTVTMFNDPPSTNATVDTPLVFSTGFENTTIGAIDDTVGGSLCYIYA